MVKVSKDPLVSIIVTNYNGLKYLRRCFDSLLKQTYKNIELIMADDHSTDGSVAFVRKRYPSIKIAVNKVNSGLGRNSNNGARLACGKYLFFYNNDTYSYPNFVEELVKAAETDYMVGMVNPTQLPYHAKDDSKMTIFQKDRGWSAGSDIYGNVCPSMWTNHEFFPDAAIFMPSLVFKKIGGFDDNFFLYGEDMDICWRIHLLGYKLIYASKAVFRHDSFCARREDGKIVSSIKRRHLVERQNINKLLKYYKFSTLLWLFPKFTFYFTLEAFFFLIIKREARVFWYVYVKAVWWNIIKIKDTFRRRAYIQKIRKVDDRYMLSIMYHGYGKIRAARIIGVPSIR